MSSLSVLFTSFCCVVIITVVDIRHWNYFKIHLRLNVPCFEPVVCLFFHLFILVVVLFVCLFVCLFVFKQEGKSVHNALKRTRMETRER